MEQTIILEAFEGPLDLLLKLIDKEKIDIYDIPINLITEQYMKYIYVMEELNLDIASDFLIMAASLLEIKSKMLLPKEKIIVEGEEVELDPRDQLVLQILSYKKFKELAEQLRESGEIEAMAYYKPQEDLSIYDDEMELGPFDLSALMSSINKIIERRGRQEISFNLEEIKRDEYSIKECSDSIINRLKDRNKISFSDFFEFNTSRNEIITYFLSVLELAKVGFISIRQNKSKSDLLIYKIDVEEILDDGQRD